MGMNSTSSAKGRGGDVSGTTTTDNEYGVGSGVSVAKASFDPGYDLGEGLGYASESDLLKGFTRSAKSTGER